jgi:hypothetical protein
VHGTYEDNTLHAGFELYRIPQLGAGTNFTPAGQDFLHELQHSEPKKIFT